MGEAVGTQESQQSQIIPESKLTIHNGPEGLDIREKTIPLPDLEIKFPYSEELRDGHNYQDRSMHLHTPGIFSEEIQANTKYLQEVKARKVQEIIDELKRRGHKTNLLVRGLGEFYDEKSPPIQGSMNFMSVKDIRRDKDDIMHALVYAVDARLIRNAEIIDKPDLWSKNIQALETTREEFLKKPVAVMVADQKKSIKTSSMSDRYEWEIKPDAVIAIFTFHINDPLVRDFSK